MLLAWLAFLTASAAIPTASALEKGDYQIYKKGYYSAFAAPFNKGNLISPRDFTEGITIQEGSFPANTSIHWSWPSEPCPSVCGFLQVSFGDYLGGRSQIYLEPRKIKDVRRIDVEHRIEIGGYLPGFNVIYDLFLSTEPHEKQVLEIEILLHASPSAKTLAARGKTLGILRMSGMIWKVSQQPNTILVIPVGAVDVLSGALDISEIIEFLRQKGRLSGEEYFHGLALGVEPRERNGNLNILSFSATLQ